MSPEPPPPDDLSLWRAFAARVTLTFPFRVDVLVFLPPDDERVKVAVELHVLDRDTREPITVRSGRHCGPWANDEDAINLVFDLLQVALAHEMYESVRLDGELVRKLHQRT